MKKTLFYFAGALTATLIAVSCEKAPQDNSAANVSGNRELQVFSCVTPDDEADQGSRVTLDGVRVKWAKDDQLSFFNGSDSEVATSESNVITGAVYSTDIESASYQADFSGTGAVTFDDNKYYALYPASRVYSWGSDSDERVRRLRWIIPNGQMAVPNDFSTKACILIGTSESENNMHFQHLVSYFKFTIDENSPKNITRVQISNGEDKDIAGRWQTFLDNLSTTGSGGLSKTITLRNSDNSPLTEGDYYITVFPISQWKGIEIAFTNSFNEKITISNGSTFNMDKGHIQPLGKVRLTSKVGDLYKEGDVNKGIVVGGDGQNGYYVMSLSEERKAWSTISSCNVDVSNTTDGSVNTANIKAAVDEDPDVTEASFPAAYHCINMGEGWYLPAENELLDFLKAWNLGNSSAFSAFNNTIRNYGGDKLGSSLASNPSQPTTQRYAASNINSDNINYRAPGFDGSYKVWNVKLTSERPVRCFKKVSL